MAPPPNLEQLLGRTHFPGMTLGESRLVRAYLERHAAEWDEADVEARLGPGTSLESPHADEKARRDWSERTRARPDVVLRSGPRVKIVEAKEHATNEGVWQVLSYRDLYRAEHPDHQVTCVIVAESHAPAAAALAKTQGVEM